MGHSPDLLTHFYYLSNFETLMSENCMSQQFRTERLLLRPLRAQDVDDICRGVGPFEVSQWMTHVPHPYGVQDALDFIERNCGSFPEVAAIEYRQRMIGVVGVQRELGYWLTQDAWGQGFASEAARHMVDWYFENVEDNVLQSGYFIANSRSKAVLERLGFVAGEIVQTLSRASGSEVPLQKMHLSRERWRAGQ
ncbi:MAG: GNAT family N-acetyltransferase [Litoreibacter sp.]